MTRILVFSPYAKRPHLTVYEGTMARACQLRGATVEYVLCDGLLPECDMHWGSFGRGDALRPLDICQRCQAGSEGQVKPLGVPYRWLGSLVSPEERRQAFTWAQSLSPSQIPQAAYQGNPLGEWVLSSVVSYFRQYPPDLNDWRVVNVYRGYVYAAAVVALGLKAYLARHQVDAALLFNGRQSITRVAFELFRAAGIRVLIHEFPFYQDGHVMLKPNARCWSPAPFVDFWARWGQVPLTRGQLDRTLNWLMNRRYGVGLSWYAYNRPYVNPLPIREQLGLHPDRRLLALFTSSTDETAGDAELNGPFESQSSWVEETVRWAGSRNDVDLVIRVHPHLAGKTGLGKAHDEFTFYERMKANAPANCRVINADETLNSYALMDAADVGLTYGSSPGIEMALAGKPVVLASRAFYENGSYTLNVHSREELPKVLEASLRPVSVRELRREAFRLASYYVFQFEMPFTLVDKTGVMDVALTYTSPEDLAAGKDHTLDRACGYLMDGDELFDSPTDADRARTTADEDAFLDEMERSADPLRDPAYERRLQRVDRLNRLGRRVQHALTSLPLAGPGLAAVGKAVHRLMVNRLERQAERH